MQDSCRLSNQDTPENEFDDEGGIPLSLLVQNLNSDYLAASEM